MDNVIFNQCRQSGDHGPINSWVWHCADTAYLGACTSLGPSVRTGGAGPLASWPRDDTYAVRCTASTVPCPWRAQDRQLFWADVRDGAAKPGWNPAYTSVHRNVIIANYGGSQGFDNDDGSSWYDIQYAESRTRTRGSLTSRAYLLLA